jgi:hypothetical protein
VQGAGDGGWEQQAAAAARREDILRAAPPRTAPPRRTSRRHTAQLAARSHGTLTLPHQAPQPLPPRPPVLRCDRSPGGEALAFAAHTSAAGCRDGPTPTARGTAKYPRPASASRQADESTRSRALLRASAPLPSHPLLRKLSLTSTLGCIQRMRMCRTPQRCIRAKIGSAARRFSPPRPSR